MTTQPFDQSQKRSVLSRYQNATVIGAGAIGLSWTALFLANGLKVTVNDPRADIKEATLKGIGEMAPTLKSLGYDISNLISNLYFEQDLTNAIKNADLIQENSPEN